MDLDEKARPGRLLLGCILVPVLLCTVFFALSTIGAGIMIVFMGPNGPFEGKIGIAAFVVVFDGLLAWFFATVARRMIASMRGHDVPHLFSPMVGVVVGGVVGLACVATGIAGLAAGRGGVGSAKGFGIGVLFLGYAGQRARAWLRHRRAPEGEPRA